MIEKVIDGIVDEISLEGQEGCTFDQLFTFAESLIAKSLKGTPLHKSIRFDDNYKSYVWLHLRNVDQLLFTMNEVILDSSALSYNEMKEIDSNNKLRVKTTEESQDQSIYGSLKSVKKSLTDNHKILLNEIAKSRGQGISQFQLGEKLKMESKVVFYYTKKLHSLGLIVKESAYADNMNTRIIFLQRFAKGDDAVEEDMDSDIYRIGTFKNNLIKQLSSAENNMMTLQDAIKAMGFVTHRNIRWARVKIAQLHDQGVVEKFNAFDGKIHKPSVRLREDRYDCNEMAEAEKSFETIGDSLNESARHESFLRDLPGEYQFCRDIASAGGKGLVRQELINKYPHIDPQILKTFLDNAVSVPKSAEHQKYAIHRAEELDGKNRLFRYFDCDGWRKLNESMGKTVVELHSKSTIKAPVLVEPTAINQIGKSFGLLPTTKIPIKRLQAKMAKETDNTSERATTNSKSKRKRTENESTFNTLEGGQSVIKPANSEASRTRKSRRTTTEAKEPEPEPVNKRKINTRDGDGEPPLSNNQSTDGASLSIEYILNEPQPKKAKRGGKASTINSTKLRRCNILLKLMEEQRIRELNTDLANEFNEIEKAAAGGQKMAVTTFNKMAKQLHEEKKLKIYVTSIQKQFGLSEIKTFLLHPAVSEDGEEMKQVLESYKMEKPMMDRNSKRKEFKSIAVEKIPSLEAPKTKPNKKDERAPMDSFSLALEYGWILSRWHRSRALHKSLIEYYTSSGNDDRIVDIVQYIKYMSLDTLITLVSSLPYSDQDFRKFVDDEENRKISLGDLPEEIRLLVFQSRLRIRYLINQFLQVLEALGVVKSLGKADTAIAPKYHLSEVGEIRDYAFKDRAIVKTLPLKNEEDVIHFWEDLQNTCVHPARHRTKADEIELEKAVDKDDPLYHIHRSRGWVVEVVLTPKQKEILDSFIDEKSPVIPSDNPALRVHLMKATKLTAKRIRAYYTGVMSALLKKQSKDERMKVKLQKRLAMSADSTINDLMLASAEKRQIDTAVNDMKQQSPFILPTFIGSRRVRRLRVRTEPFKAKDHDIRDYDSSATQNPDSLEKDLLLYAYCIMKVRAKVGTFFWDPATMIMTGKSKHQCRRLINGMKSKDPSLVITIEKLMKKWEMFYKEGIESQKIEDKNPWNTIDFDLPSYVEYFLIRLKEEGEYDIKSKLNLPLNIKELHDNYNIVRGDHDVVQAKKQTSNLCLTLDIFNESKYDVQSRLASQPPRVCEVQLVKILIKMMLMTPDHLYDSKAAFNLFKTYCHDTIEEALKDLSEEGLIIKDKSRYGRIPGRGYNVSEKFMKLAEGVLPHGLIDEAEEHFNSIAEKDTVELRKIPLNSGVAASTLSLLSQKKISLCVTRSDAFKKFRESHYFPRASAVVLQRKFIYKDLEIAIKKNGPISLINNDVCAQSMDAKISVPTAEQIDGYIKCMENDFPLVKTVYDAVKSAANQGLSLQSIKECVDRDNQANANIDQIKKATVMLIRHSPPLIHVVGFQQLRYVAAEFISSWMLKTDHDRTFINPLMWNDVSGNVIHLALGGCANAVISHILTMPGISHPNLRKAFEGFFTEYELHVLMKYLIESNAVAVKKILRSSRPSRVSIFNKRPLVKVLQNDMLISSDQVSHYWASDNYYLLKHKK